MNDNEIIALYWQRAESAVGETAGKYAQYCHSIAWNILHDTQDAEECVNDTWLRAWNAIPPQRPNCLAVFLGRITRNLSLDRCKRYTAEKRGRGQAALALDELDECVPAPSGVEQAMDDAALEKCLNRFLRGLPKQKRKVFVQRYWYLMPVREIAELAGESESQVKSALFRTRASLQSFLEREGVTL